MTAISVPSGSRGATGSAQIVQLLHGGLHRFKSATMNAILPPPPHSISVRGFLAGVVRKRLKLKLGSKKIDGNQVYQIAGAESTKRRPRKSTRQSS